MKTKKKVRLIGSISLMVAGVIVCAIGFFSSSLPVLVMGIGFFLVVVGLFWLV